MKPGKCKSRWSFGRLERFERFERLEQPQYQPLPTLSVRFASVINCNTRHAGQIEYLRRLVKHLGWFPAAEK
jgi:hypothetical protein